MKESEDILNKKNIRYFNRIQFADDGKNIIKTYVGDSKYYKKKFFDEIVWMLKAQKLIPKYIPKIVGYSLNKNNLWMKYSYIKWGTIHDHFVNDGNNLDWCEVINSYSLLMEKLSINKPKVFISGEWSEKTLDFYLKRTIKNIKSLKNNEKLGIFFKNDYLIINGKKHPSLKKILNFLENKSKKIEKNQILSKDIFYKLVYPKKERICFNHLDLVFGNIFFDNDSKTIKIIDPRGSFADSKDYGDIFYDYAKIYQCVYGLYDFIAEDKFEISFEDNLINFKISKPNDVEKVQELFLKKFFINKDIEVIKLLESIQFISMTPAHKDNWKRQAIQLCMGIQHMSEVLEDDKENSLWK